MSSNSPIKFSGIDSDSVRNHRIHAGNCILKYMNSSNTPPMDEAANRRAKEVADEWKLEWDVALKIAISEKKTDELLDELQTTLPYINDVVNNAADLLEKKKAE